MKSYKLISLLAAATVAPVMAQTNEIESSEQSSADHHAERHLSVGKMTPEQASVLQPTRPEGATELPVPKFVLHSSTNSFMLTIGAQINPILGFDFGNNLYNAVGGADFTTQSIPVPATAGHKGDFFIDALQGDVDLQVMGLANTPNAITGYVKIGTNGVSTSLKLKKAYMTWRGITAGLTSTLLKDGDACQPPTIDPEGPSGEVGGNAYEISYKSPDFNGFRFAVGLDKPTYHTSNGVYRGHDYAIAEGHQFIGEADQMVPDIPAWVQYTFSDNNRIRVSGILRNLAYRDLLGDKTRYSTGWGVMLSGNYSPVKPLIFYLQAVYGKGIGQYIQDISGLPVSYIPKDSNPTRMTPTPMMGLNFGVTYNISPRWQTNLVVSQARVWNTREYSNALDESENYKYALYGAVNVFYNITSYLQWGAECVWGHRQTWNIGGAHDTRVQTTLILSI